MYQTYNENLTAKSTISEDAEQMRLCDYVKYTYPNAIFLHVENEQTKQTNQKKRNLMGFVKGFPDIIIIAENKMLCIELKKQDKTARVSADQKRVLQSISELGHKCAVCYGFDNAVQFISQNL